MKVVPFYPNQTDNLHCLQSCVRSVLDFFEIQYKENEVDEKTGFFGAMSWSPHAVNWLFEKGLDVKLISPFEYDKLATEGEQYLRSFKGPIFDKEMSEGQYKFLDKVREASKQMVENHLWVNKKLTIEELKIELKDEKTLAIGKTIHEFLDGIAIAGTPHFVTIIKEYSVGTWLINDPGLPGIERRKVPQTIGDNIAIFGDIVLVSKRHNL